MEITILGTLPPIKGMSDICLNQVKYLHTKLKITFIDFRSIYPEFLYPGGTKEISSTYNSPIFTNLTIHKIIDWFNPWTWIKAGLLVNGSVLLFHWWTSYLFPVYAVILVLAKAKGVRLVCEVHNIIGHETSIIDRWLNKFIFALSHHFIVHSIRNKQQLVNFFAIDQDRISVIPMGSLDFFRDNRVTKQIARKKLRIPVNTKVILYFGYIRKYKGIDTLIKAFRDVKKKVPQALLIIAGINWIQWQPFQNLIDEYDLDNSIRTHLKYIPNEEVKYYFSACDVTVLPYQNYEAQCGPGLIALAFGKPLIVSDTGGLPELVKSKEVVFPPGDTHALARSIIKVLKNKTFCHQLEQESKGLAKMNTWGNHARSLVKLLRLLSN